MKPRARVTGRATIVRAGAIVVFATLAVAAFVFPVAAGDVAGKGPRVLPWDAEGFTILMTSDGLYRSDLADGAWQPRVRLPAAINVNGSELGALPSPGGHSLLFARDIKGAKSGEFFVWHMQGSGDWPAACPRVASDNTQGARHGG